MITQVLRQQRALRFLASSFLPDNAARTIVLILFLILFYLIAFTAPLHAQEVAIDKTVVSAVGGDTLALPGENLTYILSLSGVDAANNVIVTDTLPAGVTVTVSPIATGIVITQTSGAPNFAWQVSSAESFDGQITLFAKVNLNLVAGTTLTNQAGISANGDSTPVDNLAAATITILNVAPLADDESITVSEDSVATLIDVLTGDSDRNGDALVIAAVGTPNQGGSAIISGTELSYTPAANFFGTEVITYTVSDGHGGSDGGQVTITVTSVNDPPQAVDDAATVNEDSRDNLLSPLSNDSFAPDAAETLAISAIGTPDHGGSATLEGTTQIRYTPVADFFGSETFTYTLSDGNGATASANVVVTVLNLNDAPLALDDELTLQEESTNNLIDVLSNDSDTEDDLLTVTAIGTVQHGVLANLGTQLRYTPTANFFGSESFTYTISDGHAGAATATVTVTVLNVNDAPIALDDSFALDEDSFNTALSVLDNDSDLEDDPLTITRVGVPMRGTVTNLGTLLRYTPTADFAGSDAFTYTVSDGHGGTATATLSLQISNVNDPPLARNDFVTVTTTPSDQSPILLSVLNNDTSAPDSGETLTIIAVGMPNQGGSATISNSTQIAYVPLPHLSGVETFTYTIADGNGGSASALVLATVFADSDGDGIPNTLECNATLTDCPDHDEDGIPDYLDPDDDGPGFGDSDQDGIDDQVECPSGIPCLDSDADGTPDYMDLDDDNDAKATRNEDKNNDGDQNPSTQPLDADHDNIPDYLDAGTDGPGAGDSDHDGLLDNIECPTQPCRDSDNDQTPDYMDADSDTDSIADLTEGRIDSDRDGIPNFRDPDDDGDGLSTQSECPDSPPCPDSDGDGIPNFLESNTQDLDGDSVPDYQDKDADGDGLSDRYEGAADCDGDGIADDLDLDSDRDGLYDLSEAGHADLDSNHDGRLDDQTDSDQDGLPDSIDPSTGGTPLSIADSDLDGIPDHRENNGLDSDQDGAHNNEDNDDDGDGLTTREECPNGLPSPTPCTDSEQDGIPDYLESNILDLDNDGLANSHDSDADGDGLPDQLEGNADLDGDGLPNALDLDSDGDGIYDVVEAGYAALDNNHNGRIDNQIDTDGDGLANLVDANNGGVVLMPPDADSDGLPDYLESNIVDSDRDGAINAQDPDDDGDGIPTRQECVTGMPCPSYDGDFIPDYLDPADQGPGSGDSDHDSVEDASECPTGWPCLDSDGDGLPNYLDTDDDNDGLLTLGSRDFSEEGLSDLDQDGIPNYLDPASNGPGSGDSDGDGLSDHEECPTGIPCPDSDKDGIPDYMDNNGAVRRVFLPLVRR